MQIVAVAVATERIRNRGGKEEDYQHDLHTDCLSLAVTHLICLLRYHSMMFPEICILQSWFYFELRYLIAGMQEKNPHLAK